MFDEINFMPAPMASISDLPLRELYIKFGAKSVMSEMVSSEALFYQKPSDLLIKSLSEHDFSDKDYLYGVQIFGSDPTKMSNAAKFISQYPVDFIDINAGCPVKKVIKQHSGSYLLKDDGIKLTEIAASVAEAVNIPVTVKLRIGFDKINKNIGAMCKKLEQCGIAALFIHARIRNEWFSSACHWNVVKQIAESVDIPVFANGSISCRKEAETIMSQTGAKGVMMGRFAAKSPWLFSSWADDSSAVIDRHFVADVIRKHIDLAASVYKEYAAVKLRRQLMLYCSGFPNSKQFKTEICSSNNLKSTLSAVKKWENEA